MIKSEDRNGLSMRKRTKLSAKLVFEDLYSEVRNSRISHYNASFSVVIDESNAITTVIYRQLFLASLRELCIILLSK